MKITCNRGQLATAFAAVAGIVPARTPKPILQNIKLQASPGGVTLVGTDSEVAIRYRIPDADVQGGGELLLPKAKTTDILREILGDSVTIEAVENRIVIRGDRAEYKLGSEDPAEYPNVSEFDADSYHIIQAGVLKQLIHRTLFSCDTESTRYALGGILLDIKHETATFAATDTRRLAVMRGSCLMQGTVEVLNAAPVVPDRAMSLIERTLPSDNEPVWLHIDTNHILVKTPQTTVYSRLVKGRFPQYQNVIPKKILHTVELVAGPFHSAVRQSQIVTSEESRGVVFHFAAGQLTLISQAEIGDSRVDLPVGYDGPDIKIEFDPRYVADFLKVLGPEQAVKLELTDAESAALFRIEGYQYVVMPLSREK